MLKDKKKNSVLKVERPTENNPSKLIQAEESINGKKAGRKCIPVEEKSSEEISIRVTPSQKRAIEELAGLVPIATYLKSKLKECGVL